MQSQSQLVPISHPMKKVIEVPQKCKCEYDNQISAYRCSFQIQNKSLHPVYLSVIVALKQMTSTFMHFLQFQTDVTQLSAGEIKKVMARIRPPNQIYPQEFIAISYSSNPVANFMAIFNPDCIKSIIKLQLDISNIQDQQIDAMLKEYSQFQNEEAMNLFTSKDYQSAIMKAEEAFTLYRKNLRCLVIMSESQLKIGNIQKASSTIELLMYFPEHPDYFQATLIKIQTLFSVLTIAEVHNKLALVKHIMSILKDSSENAIISETNQQRLKQAMEKLHKIKYQLLEKAPNGIFEDFLEKAISKFDEATFLKEHFKNKADFSSFINHIANQSDREQCETPEYALDPINYQIFMEPVITPTGVSYQKEFIVSFFKKNGPKDPFTRDYLDPGSVFSNYTLKILVRNNPLLPKWIKYQEEAIKM